MSKLNLNMSRKGLSHLAQHILLKLQSVDSGYITNDSKLKVGTLSAPLSVVDALQALDLVHARDNKIWINSVGQAYIRRMEHLSRPETNGGKPHVSAYTHQHIVEGRKGVKDKGSTRSYHANLGETPLGWLVKRKGRDGKTLISMEQFLAGERLREDFELSGLSPHVTLNYEAINRDRRNHQGGCMGVAEHTIAAKRRLDKALDAVGPGLRDVLLRVCCHLEGLEAAEKNLGWPVRSGKVVLSIALTRLAGHYNNHIG